MLVLTAVLAVSRRFCTEPAVEVAEEVSVVANKTGMVEVMERVALVGRKPACGVPWKFVPAVSLRRRPLPEYDPDPDCHPGEGRGNGSLRYSARGTF